MPCSFVICLLQEFSDVLDVSAGESGRVPSLPVAAGLPKDRLGHLTTHTDVNTVDQSFRIAQSGLGPNSLTIGDQRAIPSATAISIGRVHLP